MGESLAEDMNKEMFETPVKYFSSQNLSEKEREAKQAKERERQNVQNQFNACVNSYREIFSLYSSYLDSAEKIQKNWKV